MQDLALGLVEESQRGNERNLVLGVYYRLPNQGEPINKACSCRRLHVCSLSSCW